MTACSLVNVPLDWEDILSWSANVLQGKGLRATLGRLILGASIYHIWQQRNDFCIIMLQGLRKLCWCRLNGKFVLDCWPKATTSGRMWSLPLGGMFSCFLVV
jgi:hypothetical protein